MNIIVKINTGRIAGFEISHLVSLVIIIFYNIEKRENNYQKDIF